MTQTRFPLVTLALAAAPLLAMILTATQTLPLF